MPAGAGMDVCIDRLVSECGAAEFTTKRGERIGYEMSARARGFSSVDWSGAGFSACNGDDTGMERRW